MNFAVDERPTDFNQFVGNESIVKSIKRGLEWGSLPHAILITGNSGTGKTTLCNLILNGLNVNKEINLHFIDCCVTKDIDSFIKIVDMIKAPAFGGTDENVAFILEECHKLSASKNAQESLLAILENLPSNKYVIATTTDQNVLLKTFTSRFVNYHLMPLSDEQMFQGILLPVIKKHGIKIKKNTVNQIINVSGGNSRKALSILSSVAFLDPEEQDKSIIGTEEKGQENLINIVNQLLDKNASDISGFFPFADFCNSLKNTGMEAEQVRCGILTYLTNLMPKVTTRCLADKLVFLFEYLYDKPCYGNNGWGIIYCCVRQYLQKFYEIF